jgi:uncharacterized protein YukE
MAPRSNPQHLYDVALAAEVAAGALSSRPQRIREAEDRTYWKGPGRERYDELSTRVLKQAEQLDRDLREATRQLTAAAKRVEDEIRLLRQDEQDLRSYTWVERRNTPSPDTVAQTVKHRVDHAPPPRDDPQWATLARMLFGRSRATVPHEPL